MAVDWDALDYSDPCALLGALRPAYYKLLAGEVEQEIEGTDRRRVRFQQTDIKAMERVIDKLDGQCRAKSGRRARFALVGRFRPGRTEC